MSDPVLRAAPYIWERARVREWEPLIAVTDTELTVLRSFPGTPLLAELIDWLDRLGIETPADAVPYYGHPAVPVGYGIRRDLVGRRVYFDYVTNEHCPVGHVHDTACFVRTSFVQLEAAPPPWPPLVAALTSGA